MPPFRNILFVQLGDIGDVVLTTPTIHSAKQAFPGARVSILVLHPFGDLLKADPAIYEVVQFRKPHGSMFANLRAYVCFIWRLRKSHYDLVIDLRTGDRGAFFSFFTGAPERVGYRGDQGKFWHSILFSKILPALPVGLLSAHPGANQSLRMLAALGIEVKDLLPKLYVSPGDRLGAGSLLAACGLSGGRWITFNPFSRWKYKEWGEAKWGETIDRLWERYRIPFVLIGSQEEAAMGEKIVAGRQGRVFNLAGKTTLGELVAVIATSTFHLGVDSAAPHIAAAVGVPTLTIHGPSDWRAWRSVDDLNRVIVPTAACVPCNRRGCDDSEISECLEQLTVEEVVAAVDEFLTRILAGH